jgi:hypothetical protein
MSELERLESMGVVMLKAPATQWPVDREGRIVLGKGSPVDLKTLHVETRECFSIEALATEAAKDGRTLFLYPNGHSPYWEEKHSHRGEWVTVTRRVRYFMAKTTEGSKHINAAPSGSDRRLLLAM